MIMGGRVEIAFCFFFRGGGLKFDFLQVRISSLQLQGGPLPVLNGVISYNFYK